MDTSDISDGLQNLKRLADQVVLGDLPEDISVPIVLGKVSAFSVFWPNKQQFRDLLDGGHHYSAPSTTGEEWKIFRAY